MHAKENNFQFFTNTAKLPEVQYAFFPFFVCILCVVFLHVAVIKETEKQDREKMKKEL